MMSVAMDSSDGLLRQALIKSYISNHSTPDCNGNDDSSSSCHVDGGVLCPTNTNMLYSTPQIHHLPPLGPSTTPPPPPPVLTPFSNSSLSTTPAPFYSKTSTPGFDPSPTKWRSPQTTSFLFPSSKSSTRSPHNKSSSSQRRNASIISPILNLVKIDEKELLKTPATNPETIDLISNLNIPDTFITSATPADKNGHTEWNRHTDAHGILTKHRIGSDLDQSALTLRLSNSVCSSLGLNRSLGKESPGTGSPSPSRKYSKIHRSDISFGKLIGKGGFGTVHAASIGERPVAVKIVQKRRGSGIHREILQAERLAFKLNLRHENIVAIFGVNMCEELRGDALIVMELVTSQSLQALLDDVTRTICLHERLDYAIQVARALHYIHAHNVAHLDVKPANVLMTSENVCKLSDFGSLTRTGPHCRKEEPEFTQLLGTLPYRAPELMSGLFPSTKADIYSYGIVLWQMLTRESPHRGANPHALIYQVVKWDIRPDVPDTGSDVIEIMYNKLYTSCWSRDMEQRPDAGDIIPAVQEMVDSLS